MESQLISLKRAHDIECDIGHVSKKSKTDNIIIVTRELVYNFLLKYCNITNVDMKWIDLDMLTDYSFNKLPEKIEINKFYVTITESCEEKSIIHPDYNIIASKIFLDKIYLNTPESFTTSICQLYNNYEQNGIHHPLINERLYNIVVCNSKLIESRIKQENDNYFDVFGLKTLEKTFLLKIFKENNYTLVERPQYLIMRVSLGIHYEDLDSVFETYEYISDRYFIHATPTLFNCGTNYPQLASCFLLGMDDDTDNIGKKMSDIINISKNSGGIGLHLHSLRAIDSLIRIQLQLSVLQEFWIKKALSNLRRYKRQAQPGTQDKFGAFVGK